MSEPEKFGSYLVYELLGSGGMATVHRAESLSAGGFRKRVALKRLLPQLIDEPDIVEAFASEAKLASHLRHANIAQTYDLGIVDGTYFIAMELVAGPTLRQLMWQCFTAAGAIPIEHAMSILVQICEALDYAHQLTDDKGVPLGIVHRDVSPANVIVSGSGVVKLIDFGLAKVRSSRGTKAGILKGKLGYMAPEYTLGQLDARADLFAVGIIAHELLTGRRLFDHQNDYEIISMLREMPIQPPSRWAATVPHDLDDIVMTALQRNPANRWQSAGALHAALVGAARELGYALAPSALAKWTEWAFTQQPRNEESGLARVIDGLGDTSETSIERALTDALPDPLADLALTPSPVVIVSPELTPTPEPKTPPLPPKPRTNPPAKPRTNPPKARPDEDEPRTAVHERRANPPAKPRTNPPKQRPIEVQPPTVVQQMPPELIAASVPPRAPPRALDPEPTPATVMPPELIAASAGYITSDTTSNAAGVFETLTPGVSSEVPTGVTTIPQELIGRTKAPPSLAEPAQPMIPTLDQLPLAEPSVPTLDQLPLTSRPSGVFATGGTDIATSVKIPMAPRASRRPLVLLALLVLVAGGAATAWYLGVIHIPSF